MRLREVKGGPSHPGDGIRSRRSDDNDSRGGGDGDDGSNPHAGRALQSTELPRAFSR